MFFGAPEGQGSNDSGFWMRQILSYICHVLLFEGFKDYDIRITGLDLKTDVIYACNQLAKNMAIEN